MANTLAPTNANYDDVTRSADHGLVAHEDIPRRRKQRRERQGEARTDADQCRVDDYGLRCQYATFCITLCNHVTIHIIILIRKTFECELEGFIWTEVKELYNEGLIEYLSDSYVRIIISLFVHLGFL